MLATELMGSNLRTRETVRCGESENKTFHEIIEASTIHGWHTFDQSLLTAVEADLITEETTIAYSTNKSRMRQSLDLLAKKRGAETSDPASGLKMQLRPASEPNRVIRPRTTPAAAS